MNIRAKAGAAGALTLAAVGAHAAIATPDSASPDAILFAEVVNVANGTAVASYAGDTGVSVSTIQSNGLSHTGQTVLGGDSNLQKLFAADGAGDAIYYAVLGGKFPTDNSNYATPGVLNFITTTNLNSTHSLGLDNNISLGAHFSLIASDISTINSNLAAAGQTSSIEGASPAANGVWDVAGGGGNLAYWDGGNTNNSNVNVGTQNLYYVTAGNGGTATTRAAYSQVGTASLTSAGLTLTGSGSPPPPVPLPAAVWLLGSGLLGLTGVARRKLKS